MSDLYRATVKPANPGYTDAEVSLYELIDDGVLVPVCVHGWTEPHELEGIEA